MCGTLANSHIKVVGLNLAYYESLTGDEGIARLLSKTIGVLPSECPERQVVELAVEQDGSTLTISSDADNVDTTLAALDNMELVKGAARDVNNLVHADRGTTVIRLSTPWLLPGLVASLLGVAGAVVLCRQRG